jgi:hypothetical protein
MSSAPKSSLKQTLKQAVASLMPTATTEADLKKAEAALLGELTAIKSQIGKLEAQRADFLLDFEKVRWPAAKQQADKATAEIEATDARRMAAEQALAELRGKLAALAEEQRRKAALDGLRDLARLRASYDRSALKLQKLVPELAASLREHGRIGRELSDRLAGIVPRNDLGMLTDAAIDERARQAFFPHFAKNPPTPDGSFNPNQWRWMQWEVNPYNADRRSFVERERDILDRMVGFFATRKEAEQVRDRLDPDGQSLHVLRDDEAMVFRLVPHRLAGDYGTSSLQDEPSSHAEGDPSEDEEQ